MQTPMATRRHRRRTAAAALTGLIALGVLPTAAGAQAGPPPATDVSAFCAEVTDLGPVDGFTDVDDTDPWAEAVRCLGHARITAGVTSGQYRPGSTVTRDQMASFIARMMDVAEVRERAEGGPGSGLAALASADGAAPFRDVPASSTHHDSIVRLAAAGIAEGGPGSLGPGRYGPDQGVTRAQMASFVVRAVEHLMGDELDGGGDHFDDDDGSVHEDAINALASAGVVQGYDDGTYRPTDVVTRGQMAWFLIRPLANLEAAGRVEPLPPLPAVDIPLAYAYSTAGVALTHADGSLRTLVSNDPAFAAAPLGPDLVAFQGWGSGRLFPGNPTGPVEVWSDGDVEPLPVPDGRTVTLFDARVVDGTPWALVWELENLDAPDSVQELVLIDVTDGTRRTVLEIPRDEQEFLHGRILADGSVVVMRLTDGTGVAVERWSPGSAGADWISEFSAGSWRQLALTPDDIVLVTSVGERPGPMPELEVTSLDPDLGTFLERSFTVIADPARTFTDVTLCTDVTSSGQLVCGRAGTTPVVLDIETGWFSDLRAPENAKPRIIPGG